MDAILRRQLLDVENDFLTSTVGDISGFEDRFRTLQNTFSLALESQSLSPDTIALAHSVSISVATLAQGFLDLGVDEERLTSRFRHELSTVLHTDDISHSSTRDDVPRRPIPSPNSRAMSPYGDSPCPPFIAPAYKWLLKNIHDPYPPKDIKDTIAHNTCTSVEHISAWFTNVRRRMGWTTISRQHFHNCRADTLDAAYRVLVQEDPKRPVEPEIAHAFMVVQVTTEGLYSSKFKRSALAGQLDVVVKDMTDEDRLRMEKMKIQKVEEEKKLRKAEKELRRQERAKQRETLKTARSASRSYPSPVGTPTEPLVPALEDSFTDESEDEECIAFPKRGVKRRVSSSSSFISALSIPPLRGERPFKRHRSDSTASGTVTSSSMSALPSPPPEVDINHGVFDYWSPEVVELPVVLDTPAPVQSHNHKRRLSNDDARGAPKRPRGLFGPRLHAVSDPLPKANEFTADFSDWFTTNFEMPPAVADEVPDPSTLLDVDIECYNWSSIQDCYKLSVDDSAMIASPPYSNQPYNSFNMDSNPFSITDINPLSTRDNLDELYHNIFGTNSHHPPPYSSQPVDGAASSLTCACVTSDSGITPTPPSMSFPDDLFSDGGAWSHLPSYADALSSFNPSSTHSSIPVSSDPLSLSSILSEIDLSMLQLPTSSPDIPRQNEETTRSADKQAKLEQLRMLEEAKRRLEAELAIDA